MLGVGGTFGEGRISGVPGVSEIEFSELSFGDQIGQGGFSVIKKTTWRGADCASKVIFDPVMTDDLLDEITNEVRMLALLRHPNIVLLMGMCTKPPNMVIVFENVSQGCLFDILHHTQKEFSMDERLRMARDIAKAFEFLHKSGIVHRDLKSLNILLDDANQVKVCDFGLARFKADLNTGSMQFAGTPTYMAPELFQKKHYDEKVDIFAFGTLLWELVQREVPYDGLDAGDIKQSLMSGQKLTVNPMVNRTIAQLIEDCRNMDAETRPDFEYIRSTIDSVIS